MKGKVWVVCLCALMSACGTAGQVGSRDTGTSSSSAPLSASPSLLPGQPSGTGLPATNGQPSAAGSPSVNGPSPTPQPTVNPQPTSLSPSPSASPTLDLGGTWVIQNAQTSSEVDNAQVEAALSTAGIRGYSLRVPWNATDGNTTLFDQGLQVAKNHHLDFAIRFMAGRWTPAHVFSAGSPYYTVSGQQVPTPFTSTGQPNTVFESAFTTEVQMLANWCRAKGVHLLHLPWYGQDWAELNNGAEVQSAQGYSYSAWLTGHERLYNIAWSLAGPDLAVEFPLSGYGPLVVADTDLSKYIANKIAGHTDYGFIQANGLNETADFGSTQPTEGQKEAAVWSQPIGRGEQMIGVTDYNWDPVYARLRANQATYVEIYVQSFSSSLANHAMLLADIASFRS